MKQPKSGGGWQAIRYSLAKAREVGPLRFWRAMHSKNACKTCAFGMGGQLGGMRNEAGHFPEVCKKSMQAMAADMRGKLDPKFFETYSIDQLRSLSSRELEAFGRLVDPVVLETGATHFRVIDWDEALSMAGESLQQAAPERCFFYASGRSSNEAGFLLQLLGRAHGTNHVNNCSFYCHQASGVGLADSLGTHTGTVDLEDLEHCDLLFLIGGNPASNHPRLMTTMMRMRKRGAKIIVVNPVREIGLINFKVPSNVMSMLLGTEIASTYVQVKIGGDIAFLAGLARALLEAKAVEWDFMAAHTHGGEEVVDFVFSLGWLEIENASGVSEEEIRAVAADYAESERTIFAWTMGITHHEHGVQNVQWIVNLALLRGMIGKPGAGVMPIRGHSNVQGMGSVGVSPKISKAALAGLHKIGIAEPAYVGYDTMQAMEAASRGEMDFAICLGGNLYGANPDATFSAHSLAKIKDIVYLSTTLNTGHVHGTGGRTLILPVLARDEEPQSTTQESMFSYVRLSDGGVERWQGPRAEVDILAEVGRRGCRPTSLDWRKLSDHDEIRRLIAELVPPLEPIATIGQTKKEFEIPRRILHGTEFPSESGRASFHAHPLPTLAPLGPGQLRLMTVRSEGQFNTVVYEDKDPYRGQERRDVILVNPIDLERLGFEEDQPVRVFNATGSVDGIRVRSYDIAEGCALMYYPEANVLVPRAVDPRSKTPAFKSTVVNLEESKLAMTGTEEDRIERVSDSSKNQMRSC